MAPGPSQGNMPNAAPTIVKVKSMDMELERAEKKMSFAQMQQLCFEEIVIIGKVIKILSFGDVSGNADERLSLAQTNKIMALLQVVIGEASLSAENDCPWSKQSALPVRKLIIDPSVKVKFTIDFVIKCLAKR
eukprot:16055937-Heterocapsa_arctica.AAC.1